MAKPTNSQLIAALELANARIALLESKLATARECYVEQRTAIVALEGRLANALEQPAPQPARVSSWQPSAKMLAAKALAMSSGQVAKVVRA